MKFVVYRMFGNQSNDPPDALDIREAYQLSNSAAAARRRPHMSPTALGLHRIVAMNSRIFELAAILWLVAGVPVSFRARG